MNIRISQKVAIKLTLLLCLISFPLLNGCYMLQSSGDYFGINVTGKNVVFLLDISGSMEGKDEGPLQTQVFQQTNNQIENTIQKSVGGELGNMLAGQFRQETTKLGSAKRELIPAIRGLPADARFTLITFGGKVANWQIGLVDASTMNKNMATYHVKTISSGGGTCAFMALKRAFLLPGVDTIYFLSDGQPTDASASTILKSVARLNQYGAVTIHTIGLGEDQNRDFLCKLASGNRGVYMKDAIVQCGFLR